MCRVKIKGGRVTGKELNYNGSISIDAQILERSDLVPGEMVDVLNLSNGARITTYIIEGRRGTGEISLNGPAARFFEIGDEIVVLCTCLVDSKERENWNMRVISLSNGNREIS
jgi:aspartate 1-decarboxylase